MFNSRHIVFGFSAPYNKAAYHVEIECRVVSCCRCEWKRKISEGVEECETRKSQDNGNFQLTFGILGRQ